MSNTKARVLWNREGTQAVMSSKLRSFGIYERTWNTGNYWALLGWFNAEESFCFGSFPSQKEAQDFLANLQAQIEA